MRRDSDRRSPRGVVVYLADYRQAGEQPPPDEVAESDDHPAEGTILCW
ncbi:hypothetical protein ACRCUN_22530 [Mycobacterium sp. LTG2003]